MKFLAYGSKGASVELLQLALNRFGFTELAKDGFFGSETRRAVSAFQKSRGLTSDGAENAETHRALLPWYTGYLVHKVSAGESLYSIAEKYSTGIEPIITANPGINAENLKISSSVIVPLDFPVVPTDISCGSRLCAYCVRGLAARYPFIISGDIGKSVLGRPIWSLTVGRGSNSVLYTAGQHANEWITSLVLLKYIEDLCVAFAAGGEIFGESAAEILDYATICFIPALNPDGMDLVTGDISEGSIYDSAKLIAEKYPQFPFPSGWKANIRGTDLNLQFPANWEKAKEIKFSQGITAPAPADFVGKAPLSAPESKAIYDLTLSFNPALILAYHTQGEVIYWKYLDYEPYNSRKIAELFSQVSSYAVEETPYASGFAGYKDWFIQDFDRPGYTIEAGIGNNPLPISDFDEIYRKNKGILTLGTIVT